MVCFIGQRQAGGGGRWYGFAWCGRSARRARRAAYAVWGKWPGHPSCATVMSRPVRRSLGGGQAATVAGLVKSTHLKPGDTRSANGYPRPNGSRSPHFATLGRALAPEALNRFGSSSVNRTVC
jgi:hypothetical protein